MAYEQRVAEGRLYTLRDPARKSWEGLDFDGKDGGKIVDNGVPRVAGVIRTIDLSAGGAEVDAAGIEPIHGHGVAKNIDVAILLGKALGEGFPFVAARAAAVDAQLAFVDEMFAVALDGNDVDSFGFVGVNVNDEAEIGGKIAADFVPLIAGVIAAHDVPMFLHEENIGTRRMQGDVMDTVADFGVLIGNVRGTEAAVDGRPGFAAVVGAEGAGGGNGDVDAVEILGILDDGVEAHGARAGLPLGAGAMAA